MADEIRAPKRSTRDLAATRARLEAWLAERLPGARIAQLASPSGTGMSSETLLFDAAWREGGAERSAAFVARVAPDPRDVPVFPSYELATQFRVMQLAARGGVPVPRVRWLEEDASRIGSPFFVMDRVAGRVPPDIMPYPMGSWLSEASPSEQRTLAGVFMFVALAQGWNVIGGGEPLFTQALRLFAPGGAAFALFLIDPGEPYIGIGECLDFVAQVFANLGERAEVHPMFPRQVVQPAERLLDPFQVFGVEVQVVAHAVQRALRFIHLDARRFEHAGNLHPAGGRDART